MDIICECAKLFLLAVKYLNEGYQMLIKYYLNPAIWVMSNYDKEIAKAKYKYTGKELKSQLLKIELHYNNISEYEYDTKIHDLNHHNSEDADRAKELLIIELKHDKISIDEYEKEIANIDEEPFVRVLNINLDGSNPSSGFFEIDFNSYFVEHLMDNGYVGKNNDAIIDAWFNDLCKNIVLDELQDNDGVAKSFLTNTKEGEIITRIKNEDGTADYF